MASHFCEWIIVWESDASCFCVALFRNVNQDTDRCPGGNTEVSPGFLTVFQKHDIFHFNSKTDFSFPDLYVTQCLAHVEAYIDFSEDELIEDGVLNQGTNTLCPLR